MIAGLWIGSILLALAGIVLKILYKPAQKAGDFFLTVYFLLTLFMQLAAFYFTSQKTAFGATLAFMLFLYYWLLFAPFYPHSDPAGDGMARGFRSFYIIIACLIWGIISFLLIKFLKPDGIRVGVYIVSGMAALIGLYNIFKNRQSFLSGDSFEDVFENSDETTQAEFMVTVGKTQSDFSFTLKLGDKHYELKKSELRLYKVNQNERGKIVFKSYKGEHKNILNALESGYKEAKKCLMK